MSITEQNGSSVLAMTGKNCVAIASDKRLGEQMLTVSTNYKRIFQMNERIFLGLSGLATDVSTVYEKLRYDVNLLELREEKQLDPKKFRYLLQSLLYQHRFGPYFVMPVIAGLQPETNEPYIAMSDGIGAFSEAKDFECSGTSIESLVGVCESLWKPGMDKDELFNCITKCLQTACERDGLSGWGGVVYIMTPEHIITYDVRTRMD